MDKDRIMKKWQPIVESLGITGSKSDWISQYEFESLPEIQSENESDYSFPSLLPMSFRIAAQTIGMDLVSVQPIGHYVSRKEIRIKKIESILEKIRT